MVELNDGQGGVEWAWWTLLTLQAHLLDKLSPCDNVLWSLGKCRGRAEAL